MKENILEVLQGVWDDANAQAVSGDNSRAHAQYLKGFLNGIRRAMNEIELGTVRQYVAKNEHLDYERGDSLE